MKFAAAYHGKTVAITGASGYIGAALVEALTPLRVKLLRVSRKTLHSIPGTESLTADIRSPECWREIVSRADVVFHLAGNTSVYAAAADPMESLTSTVQPVVQLISAAQALHRKVHVVLAGTATQYGFTEELPVSEATPMRPATVYDLHKQVAEDHLMLATRQGLLKGTSLRLANVYGPSGGESSAADRGVLNRMARTALQGKTLLAYNDGKYVRDYIYISDVVSSFLAAGSSDSAVGRPLNVGSGQGTTIREAFHLIAQQARNKTGTIVAIQDAPWPEGLDPIEKRNYVADIRAIAEATNWAPAVTLEQGINQMIQDFSSNQSIIAADQS